MRPALRTVFVSLCATALVAAVIAVLSLLLPSRIAPGWAVVAVGVFAGLTMGARAEGQATPWSMALAQGGLAAITVAVTLWWLGAP